MSWCSSRADPISTSLPLLGFISQHSCCASPFHSSGHLLHLYLFYSHELFAKSFGLPQPNYHILTSYYFFRLIGLEANPIDLLIHFLGFPGPFTSFLPLIVPMSLLLHSLGFLDPFTSSLPLIILVSLCWPLFLPFQPAEFTLPFSLLTFFILLGFFCYRTFLSKVGINKKIPPYSPIEDHAFPESCRLSKRIPLILSSSFFLFFFFFLFLFIYFLGEKRRR